jgi:hypothetical protein
MTTTPQPQTPEPFDVAAVLAAAGTGWLSGPGHPSTAERTDAQADVELLDADSCEIGEPTFHIDAFVDGIQARMTLCHIDHREVALAYVAAGAGTSEGALAELSEKLFLIGAREDRDQIMEIAAAAGETALPVEFLTDIEPNLVANACAKRVETMREQAESAVIKKLLETSTSPFVIDGDLPARDRHPHLIGVAKTHRTRYLPDESSIWALPAGWRSPRFTIKARGEGLRVSTYLRLHSAAAEAWDFGLVRVEAFDADALDAACAAIYQHRQPAGVSDGRWDRHLGPVSWCEIALRDRRPPEFGHSQS